MQDQSAEPRGNPSYPRFFTRNPDRSDAPTMVSNLWLLLLGRLDGVKNLLGVIRIVNFECQYSV
jgi:hypothetical protein